jgi:nucleotide-binding universal stress UspA family protein
MSCRGPDWGTAAPGSDVAETIENMTSIFAFREEAGLRRFKPEAEGAPGGRILAKETNYRMNTPHSSPGSNRIGLRLDDVNFQRVLVPVDFSVCTLETLRYAKTLVGKSDVVIDVLHVIQPSLGRNESVMPAPGLLRTLIEGARQELKKLVGVLWANEARAAVSIRVREGRADEVIIHEAGNTHASLIIMGMRNCSWLSGLLRRHTVKRVLQNAPCPVMVLRPGMTARRVFP